MVGDWEETTIGEHIELATGEAFQSALFGTTPDSGTLLARGDNVKEGEFEWGEKARYWPKLTKDLERYLLREGDVLLGMDGSKVGKNWVRVRNKDLPCLLVQRVARLRAKPTMDQGFLRYIIGNPQFRDYVARVRTGTSIPHISGGQIKSYEVLLPPLAEQRAIAAVLGALDDKIELNRRMNTTLESMARALFQSWFVNFDPVRAKLDGRKPEGLDEATASLFPEQFEESVVGNIPSAWSFGPITECCNRIHSGGTPRRDEPEYWRDGTIPWLTSGEVRQPMITSTESYISELGLNESAAKWIPANSTVVALYGATAGQVSFLGTSTTTNQAICSLVPKSGFEFFNYFAMRGATAEMESKAVGSAQQNISKGVIEETVAILPPPLILNQFNSIVAPLFANWIANTQQSRTLATLRDTLLPKLLSGELSVAAAAEQQNQVLPLEQG